MDSILEGYLKTQENGTKIINRYNQGMFTVTCLMNDQCLTSDLLHKRTTITLFQLKSNQEEGKKTSFHIEAIVF